VVVIPLGPEQIFEMSQRRQIQGGRQLIHNRCGFISEAAPDLLMKTEDGEVGWGVNEAGPDDIADATSQYEIIVPFASRQNGAGRHSDSFVQPGATFSSGENGSNVA
jgi:hypothetical protein